jgi:archaetidylinositol phosphate synthase
MTRGILRIWPTLATIMGLVAAAATAATSPHWWSAIFLVLSLLLSRFDKNSANYLDPKGRMRRTIDAIADRISDVFWAIAFYRLGVPVAWVFAFAALAVFQEYAKVRFTLVGMQHVGLVTMADRAVRAGFLFIAILLYQFTDLHMGVMGLAVGLTLLQTLSFLLFLRFAFKQLH